MTLSRLLKKIHKFNGLASFAKKDLNFEEIILEISKEKSLNKKIKIAKENFQELGEGSARFVFKIDDKFIIKLAKDEKGIAQNKFESSIKSPITAKIFYKDPEDSWIICQFAEKLSEKEFKEFTKFSLKDFYSALSYKMNMDSYSVEKPENYDILNENEFFNEVLALVLNNDLQIGDLQYIDSWGKIDNKPKLIDFGLSRDIFEEYYE